MVIVTLSRIILFGVGVILIISPFIFKKVPVARVINLEDGEQYEVVLGSTLISQLQDNYPEDAVNGKSFEITKHGKKTGKRYHTYTVYEIEVPTAS